jgi:hypothetical protein
MLAQDGRFDAFADSATSKELNDFFTRDAAARER